MNAWDVWYELKNIDTVETYNVCVYPHSINWYIIRAGENLYPMIIEKNKFIKE